MFHFGSNKLWKTVPTFAYMWKHTLRHIIYGKMEKHTTKSIIKQALFITSDHSFV